MEVTAAETVAPPASLPATGAEDQVMTDAAPLTDGASMPPPPASSSTTITFKPIAPPPTFAATTYPSSASSSINWNLLRTIHKKLFAHKSSLWFRVPVDPIAQGVPTYFDIIKHPMDLSTIGTKLKQKAYARMDEFDEDVRLIFANCLAFNGMDSEPAKEALRLEKYFERLLKDAEKKQ